MGDNEFVDGLGLEPERLESLAAGRSAGVGGSECLCVSSDLLDVRFKLEWVRSVTYSAALSDKCLRRMLLMPALPSGLEIVQFGITIVVIPCQLPDM